MLKTDQYPVWMCLPKLGAAAPNGSGQDSKSERIKAQFLEHKEPVCIRELL